jgi:hypothetical protein
MLDSSGPGTGFGGGLVAGGVMQDLLWGVAATTTGRATIEVATSAQARHSDSQSSRRTASTASARSNCSVVLTNGTLNSEPAQLLREELPALVSEIFNTLDEPAADAR